LLGALFSAELSAADAVLFMLTTSIAKDLYKTFLRPEADDGQLLLVARLTAIACGLLGAGLAIWFGSVIVALKIFYTMLSAALLLPLIAGLYTRRTSARAAISTMAVSVAITFALERWTNGKGKWGLPSLILGTLAGLIAMMIVSLSESKSEIRDSRSERDG